MVETLSGGRVIDQVVRLTGSCSTNMGVVWAPLSRNTRAEPEKFSPAKPTTWRILERLMITTT